MTRILLVEDDRSLGATLTDRLGRERYEVVWVTTRAEAEAKFSEPAWDLIILDIMLPDGSGFTLAEELRERSSAPIVFMTALGSAENRLAGYELGAVDFIPKPFHLRELLLRVRRILDAHAPRRIVACGDRRIDLDALCIHLPDGRREYPPSRDVRVLRLLVEQAPRVVSRNEIIDRIWGEDVSPTPRTVDNTIVRLRQALQDRDGRYIRSVRGVGYQWAAPGSDADG